MHFSIVIPLYNEEENISFLFKEIQEQFYNLKDHVFEVILVNDCSSDNTLKIITEIKDNNLDIVKVVDNLLNSGQSKSILNGVLASKYENIITIDGDLQNDPNDIPKLIKHYVFNQDISLVGGIRAKRKDSLLKRLSSFVANKVRSRLLDDGCVDTGCGLKIFEKKIFLEFSFFNGIHRFLPALFKGYGKKLLFVDVNHRPRYKGKSNYGTISRLVNGLIDTYRVYKTIKSKMIAYLNNLNNLELIFLIIGFLGQGLFASRFIIQWIYSEKKGESSIPIVFWYLSIFGGIGLLIYAIFRKDPVIIIGQSFGIVIYLRNLILIYKKKNEKN